MNCDGGTVICIIQFGLINDRVQAGGLPRIIGLLNIVVQAVGSQLNDIYIPQ